MNWEAARTPEARFATLPQYDFAAHRVEHDGVEVHYLDVGAGRPVVLFHGEPTWSFLYRRVIPPILATGHRVIAPDYPGFGKSDKPIDPNFYTYDRHVEFMEVLLEHAGVSEATAVVQDWGGPIGLRLATDHPEWFDRLVIMNTGLFSGGTVGPGFTAWRDFVANHPDLPVRMIMQRSAVTTWTEDVLDAYEAPFPDVRSKVGAYRFPLIVPTSRDAPGADSMAAVKRRLSEWEGPALVLFSTGDPIFSVRVGERFVERIPGADQLHLIENAGHFLQEDQGERVGARIAAFLRATS